MSETISKNPWFSYFGGHFKGTEPYFFDKNQFPWVSRIESEWTTIRDELLQLVEQEASTLVPYANPDFTRKKSHWRTFGLMFWSLGSKTNCAKAPKTWEILRTIPGITAASFNLLDGGATIKEHYGDTNAIMRCHLGLVIPAPAPQCAFRVGKEVRSWKEGELMMFCDAHNHTAWNNTDQNRYIVLFDVMRPEFMSKKTAICSRVLASINREIAYKRVAWLPRFFGHTASRVFVFNLFRTFYWLVLRLHIRVPMLLD